MKPRFFKTPTAFGAWLEKHHAKSRELLVGFHKKGSGKPSMTWPESVDCALCVGWIDGIRKRVDDDSYTIRFTPRRTRSIWSAVNIKRVGELAELGLMRPAGLAAFAVREENRSGIYAYEQRTDAIPEPYAKVIRKNKPAWAFFQAQPPSYRKKVGWWVVCAKQEATRLDRLARVIEACAAGRRL
jgi:uncharacterized protein YdeI (YjbR/CyaY-like superfamily)